jgi:excisionase family DNA binding protein
MTTDLPQQPLSASSPTKLLTYPEAACLLGVKIGTVYSLVSQRRIPHVRLSGRLVRFERRALEAYIAARRVDIG